MDLNQNVSSHCTNPNLKYGHTGPPPDKSQVNVSWDFVEILIRQHAETLVALKDLALDVATLQSNFEQSLINQQQSNLQSHSVVTNNGVAGGGISHPNGASGQLLTPQTMTMTSLLPPWAQLTPNGLSGPLGTLPRTLYSPLLTNFPHPRPLDHMKSPRHRHSHGSQTVTTIPQPKLDSGFSTEDNNNVTNNKGKLGTSPGSGSMIGLVNKMNKGTPSSSIVPSMFQPRPSLSRVPPSIADMVKPEDERVDTWSEECGDDSDSEDDPLYSLLDLIQSKVIIARASSSKRPEDSSQNASGGSGEEVANGMVNDSSAGVSEQSQWLARLRQRLYAYNTNYGQQLDKLRNANVNNPWFTGRAANSEGETSSRGFHSQSQSTTVLLGRLDSVLKFKEEKMDADKSQDTREGIIGPDKATAIVPMDRNVIRAVLRELDPIELQRQILFAVAKVQRLESLIRWLQADLEKQSKSPQVEIVDRNSKSANSSPFKTIGNVTSLSPSPVSTCCANCPSLRQENEALRFKVSEQEIQLEGTRARLRLLEKSQRIIPSPQRDLLRSDLDLPGKVDDSTSRQSPLKVLHVTSQEDITCDANHKGQSSSYLTDTTANGNLKLKNPSPLPQQTGMTTPTSLSTSSSLLSRSASSIPIPVTRLRQAKQKAGAGTAAANNSVTGAKVVTKTAGVIKQKFSPKGTFNNNPAAQLPPQPTRTVSTKSQQGQGQAAPKLSAQSQHQPSFWSQWFS